MVEEIPELKQFSPFAFSMLNNSRFVIKIKPIKLKPCNEISRQIKRLWSKKDDRRNTCAEMIIEISDNYAEKSQNQSFVNCRTDSSTISAIGCC